MTITTLSIIAIILAAVSAAGCFIPRFPSVAAGWLALLCMHFAGQPFCNGKVLLFWGIASAIVLMTGVLQPKALTALRRGHAYVAAGALVGALLGFLVRNITATIILGSVIGAFLGCVAYMRTPRGLKLQVASSEFLQYLCAKGLPAVVSCSMSAIVLAMVL